MEIKNVGVVSPGDMGQAIAIRLKECGLKVHTALDGRSARTQALARDAGIKMCYAAMTKGTTALAVELLMAARKLGVEHALEKELRESRNDVFEWQMRNITVMPPKAYRWVPEMQEIAKTFGELGMTRRIFEGAADVYSLVAATPLGKESPEQARKAGRSGLDVTRELAEDK